jgi:hypothetical protein
VVLAVGHGQAAAGAAGTDIGHHGEKERARGSGVESRVSRHSNCILRAAGGGDIKKRKSQQMRGWPWLRDLLVSSRTGLAYLNYLI